MVKKRDILAIILTLIIMALPATAFFYAKPSITNNNYTVNIPQDILKAPQDYRISQQIELYKNQLKEEFNKTVQDLNTKFNMMIAILAIAVAVWVGLNIYSIVDRRELDKMAETEKDLRQQLEERKKQIEQFKNSITLLETALDNMNSNIENYKNDLDKQKETIAELEGRINQVRLHQQLGI